MSDSSREVDEEQKLAIRKLRDAMLEHGVKVYCRISENDELSYTLVFGGRGDVPPNLLSTLLVWGVYQMKTISQPKVEEEVERSDGTKMVYDNVIWFDFNSGKIFHSLEDDDLMQTVMSCVVENLQEIAMAEARVQAEMN